MTEQPMFQSLTQRLAGVFPFFSDGETKKIGIYGPTNAGKSTLGNQMIHDWGDNDDAEFETSDIEHETQSAQREPVTIERDGGRVELDIVDTPGVTTEVDYKEFIDDMEKAEAIERSRGATEGVAEAMHWLREDVDGVIYVLDSTKDPFTQVNTMLTGIIESQNLPTVILANKTDLDESNVSRIKDAFPQHTIVSGSAKEAENLDELYGTVAETFG